MLLEFIQSFFGVEPGIGLVQNIAWRMVNIEKNDIVLFCWIYRIEMIVSILRKSEKIGMNQMAPMITS